MLLWLVCVWDGWVGGRHGRPLLLLLDAHADTHAYTGLSLQRLWFFLQPSLRTLAVLDALCAKVLYLLIAIVDSLL